MDGTVHQRSDSSGGPPLLAAMGLRRRGADRMLLEDVSVAVQGGDRIAIVGPTGSGKTLLLRSLAMLDPVDAGEIRWQEQTVSGNEVPKFRCRVIYLHQRPALVEGSVEDNLRQPFSLRVHRRKTMCRDRLVELLKLLGQSESFLSKRQQDLSGGEAQLAALLRAIQLDPNILLLDEPTAALDAEATEVVETLVRNWLDERPTERATVWVTHDREQARRVSTSVLEIREGKLT